MDSLVSTDWLAAHLRTPDLVVLDCSVRVETDASGAFQNISGRADFEDAHIPGAGFADLTEELCDATAKIEFALPDPRAFCDAMGQLGVGDDSRVVLYDSMLNAWAARVWWMLRWVGFDRAAILDGGLDLWRAEGRPLVGGPSAVRPRTLTPRPRPHLIADMTEVRAAVAGNGSQLIDTLPTDSFNGEVAIYGRGGHIPGAVNVCGMELVDETGRYRPQAQLQALHMDVPGDGRKITYCGGGILASSNAFIMTRLGYRDVAVYTASLQEWAADPENPMVPA